MAVVTYQRWKFFWGAVDVTVGSDPYGSDEKTTLGATARDGDGVGARRAQIVFSRTAPGTFAEDVAVMHFDFLNITGGAPDDTWTTGDYTGLEAKLGDWWNAVKVMCTEEIRLKELRWYRFGTGVTPPNPPERITAIAVPGTSTSGVLPPQIASAVSLHVAPRRSWGRTYLPGLTGSSLAGHGVMQSGSVDILKNATAGLVTAAAASDVELVVYSKHLNALLKVEQVAVDNIFDIIRRRRWEHPTYRVTTP